MSTYNICFSQQVRDCNAFSLRICLSYECHLCGLFAGHLLFKGDWYAFKGGNSVKIDFVLSEKGLADSETLIRLHRCAG